MSNESVVKQYYLSFCYRESETNHDLDICTAPNVSASSKVSSSIKLLISL